MLWGMHPQQSHSEAEKKRCAGHGRQVMKPGERRRGDTSAGKTGRVPLAGDMGHREDLSEQQSMDLTHTQGIRQDDET